MNRRTIVAANWKMHGDLALVSSIANTLKDIQLSDQVSVVICPSFPYLAAFSNKMFHENTDGEIYESVHLGAQNLNEHEMGAYTGEVSGAMLQELAVEYVIVGHSERRSIYKETSYHVAEKVKAALQHNLTPILCIGESEAERVAGHTETVLAAQLQPVIDLIGITQFSRVVIAYEPIWAIGTGKTASPEMAQQTHHNIREFLAKHNSEIADRITLLYGGSVNSANCNELFAQPDIDGGLVGGASLNVEQFTMICSTAKGH
jgi:triosephosphate isomerase (TIM)